MPPIWLSGTVHPSIVGPPKSQPGVSARAACSSPASRYTMQTGSWEPQMSLGHMLCFCEPVAIAACRAVL